MVAARVRRRRWQARTSGTAHGNGGACFDCKECDATAASACEDVGAHKTGADGGGENAALAEGGPAVGEVATEEDVCQLGAKIWAWEARRADRAEDLVR